MKIICSIHFALILIAFLLAVIIVNPIGEFCTNDDWSYAKPVYHLLNGEFSLSNWNAVPLLTQLLWGYVWVKAFGFSFTILRFSTLFLSFIGVLTMNSILTELKVKSTIRNFSLLIFTFNPIYFHLSNSFMTDVPAIVFSLLSFLFLLRYNNLYKTKYLLLGAIFLAMGTLIRQPVILIGLAFTLNYLFNKPTSHNYRKLFCHTIPFLFSFLSLMFYQWLINLYQIKPDTYNLQFDQFLNLFNKESLLPHFNFLIYHLYNLFVFTGITLSPIIIILFSKNIPYNKAGFYITLVILLLILFFKLFTGRYMPPFTGDVFYSFGFGPFIETGFQTQLHKDQTLSVRLVWFLISSLGIFCFSRFIASFKLNDITFNNCTLALYTGFHFLLALNYLSDRYYLILMPFSIIAITLFLNNVRNVKTLPIIASFLFIGMTIISSRDFMEMKRIRTNALNYLTEDLKILPNKIDGGFEFNAWHFYSSQEYLNRNKTPNKPWWWVIDNEFIVSKHKKENYSVINEFSFFKWTSMSKEKVYVLQK